jgi:hypothetical protein
MYVWVTRASLLYDLRLCGWLLENATKTQDAGVCTNVLPEIFGRLLYTYISTPRGCWGS